MANIIHSISICDFRSFANQDINLSDVTCLIGANESGKTNLLDAIYLAKLGNKSNPDDKQIIKKSDIRKNSEKYVRNQLPIISYEIDIKILLNSPLNEFFQDSRSINLTRDGNDIKVEILPITNDISLVKNISTEIINISSKQLTERPPESTENVKELRVKNNNPEEVITIKPNSYILMRPDEYIKNQILIDEQVEKGNLKIFKNEEINLEIEEDILKEINKNLKIFTWSNDEKYHLPDLVSIENIKTKLDEMPVIKSLFKLGGYDPIDIPKLLENQTETDFANIFTKLSEDISKKIQSKWRTNKRIEIIIEHKKDHLLINIKEPGYQIEPKYRSEGLKWFLSFIIGMIAQEDELKDNVILIDEPALHLHPGGQKDVLKEINNLAKENQIIYSTHSHFMIDKRFRDRVKFLIKEIIDDYSLTEVKIPTNEDIFKDPLLRSALIYSISDFSYLNEINILVEGIFDKNLIDLICNWQIKNNKSSTINLNDTSIINCDGASEIKKHAKLYKGSGLLCLSLYDSDKSGKDAFSANIEQKNSEKILVGDIYDQAQTMEDLFPVDVFKEILEKWSSENNIQDEKIMEEIRVPRMNRINQALDSYCQKNKIEGKDQSDARLTLKHDLEDRLIEKLKILLDELEPDDKGLTHFIKLNEYLFEKTAALLK